MVLKFCLLAHIRTQSNRVSSQLFLKQFIFLFQLFVLLLELVYSVFTCLHSLHQLLFLFFSLFQFFLQSSDLQIKRVSGIDKSNRVSLLRNFSNYFCFIFIIRDHLQRTLYILCDTPFIFISVICNLTILFSLEVPFFNWTLRSQTRRCHRLLRRKA